MRHALLASLVAACAGCAHHPEVLAGTTPAKAISAVSATPRPSPQASARSRSLARCSDDPDCGSQELCVRGQCVEITASLPECSSVRVSFEFNSTLIRDGVKRDLQRSARCLEALSSLHVIIAGSADERGTDEYNMALGDQRATAVARYLRALGTSEAQLSTVSYGKERPLCVEHDEACWARNRRADLDVAGR